jgi:hypothetical protein
MKTKRALTCIMTSCSLPVIVAHRLGLKETLWHNSIRALGEPGLVIYLAYGLELMDVDAHVTLKIPMTL